MVLRHPFKYRCHHIYKVNLIGGCTYWCGKDLNDVKKIYNRFCMWGKHREAELVVFGCNVAMRITDMLNIKFADIKQARHEGNITYYIELIEGEARKPRRVYPMDFMLLRGGN